VYLTSVHFKACILEVYRVVAMKLSRGAGISLIDPVNAQNFLRKEMISADLQLNFRKILENVLFHSA